MRMSRYVTLGAVSAVTLAVAAAGCGSGGSTKSASSGGGGGGTVDIYSSLPLQGASRDQFAAMINGMKLRLSQSGGKAGKFKVKYTSLDDSTPAQGGWDPGQVAKDARQAVQDSKTIFYLGEYNSGGNAISIPILNQGGVPQITPGSTYVGLTTNDPGSAPGEPQKYYPTGKRTFVRVVPRDTIQAGALLKTMKADGCKAVGIANDKDTYGQGLAKLLTIQAAKFGVHIASNTGIEKTSPNFRSYAARLKSQGVDCFLFSGVTPAGGVQVTKDVGNALPNAKLYAPDGACESAMTNPAKKGLPKAFASRFQCTVPTLDLKAYPGGQQFLRDYAAKYGNTNPDPYAIYGYAAMQVALDTIKSLGSRGNDRAAVLQSLFSGKPRSTVLGTLTFDRNGDINLTDYGLYKIGPDGDPTYFKTVK
jgi:branched-chain amino acid transport system substrate-binding protein